MLEWLNKQKYILVKNVHTYRQGDLRIAHDVNSGSLHLLDEETFAVLKACEDLQSQEKDISAEKILQTCREYGKSAVTEEVFAEILAELAELFREGTLFSPEVELLPPSYPEQPMIKALCLHVAHDCNLRCRYCFAGTGAFGGTRRIMDLETGKRAVDFVLAASGQREHCEIDFFGGEPLLNFTLIQELVKYGNEAAARQKKNIKFTLTTNGLLLDEAVKEFLEREEISVVLSLDGRPEINDRMRPHSDGRGSYANVMPRIQSFTEKRPSDSPFALGTYYYVRGTYTRLNPDFDKDVQHLADLGLRQISLEPVVAGPGAAYALREEDLPGIYEAYDRLGEEILARRSQGNAFNFFHFNVALDQGPCLIKRLSGCGAGHEYAAVSPEGDIYPCHQFVGQAEYKLGSLCEESSSVGEISSSGEPHSFGKDVFSREQPGRKFLLELKAELVRDFRSADISAKLSCRICWARFACSGGCHAANVASTGSLKSVYELGCALQKKRLEVAFYVKIKETMVQ